MVLAILGSYAVQFYVPMEIIWPTLSAYFQSSRSKLIAEYIFRTILVIVTCKKKFILSIKKNLTKLYFFPWKNSLSSGCHS
jgi:hypothetical protein